MGENMRGKRGENLGKMRHIPREGEVSSHPCHAIGCMATIVHYTVHGGHVAIIQKG